ncbi:MarR family transcriptional regulator [uncultured Thalassospira sp.]|uniref:MarR family winged helix-turn-helix transcriptional regulator n=1 Tax=uncultured Thalassospira sp. TaxID=404382 RepID=UPI0030DA0E51|tara:strand:- start:198 stop:683 length:486 start_codon:yes stop_codon:yes gene_type:complete
MSRKSVQNTHINMQMRNLHGALIEIISVMNRPQRDDAMIREAGITLDRALFPLLVLVEKLGPIGIVDLAERVGRDHTTVSRQIAKLENLGLITRQSGATDKRVRHAIIAPAGKQMTDAIDRARERIGQAIFNQWDEHDLSELVRLTRKFADAIKAPQQAES